MSTLWGEKPKIWPFSKLSTGSYPMENLVGNKLTDLCKLSTFTVHDSGDLSLQWSQ